ncbi:hypothetical protein SDC9_160815 [bioreactor metagenome]|uniref:RNA polymerase sigma factor 70 region 4 type 2 domain-containing protein n=1 Tax=bioreactor metagenome TaxID=1076179 RepID=A0A645FM53_9ZZZZ
MKGKTAADIREEQLNAKLAELAEQGNWTSVLKALDDYDTNNERRHSDHRADMDVTIVDRDPEEGECYRVADLLKLSCWEDWDDIIFSQKPEDLHHLVEEYPTSAAFKELSPRQKEILLENIVHGMTTQKLADNAGCSIRNITKQRQKALERVRWLVTGNSGECYPDTAAIILGWMVLPTFMIGWETSKRIYPRIRRALFSAA